MNTPTSWTSQQVMRKCPRRFEYRYGKADPTGRLKALRKLMSIRELAGYVIHMEMARVIREIAAGERLSDQDQAPAHALREFDLIVAESTRTPPGILHGDTQVSEMFHGFPCLAEIGDWKDKIPVAVENGIRLAHYFGFRRNHHQYCLESEHRGSFFHRRKDHRFVIDVLLREGINTSVYDWKVHEIRDADCRQVALYQNYIATTRQISPTRVYGFAVDLLRERVVPHHYRAIEHTFAEVPNPSPTPSAANRLIPKSLVDDYPSRPSKEACRICPFASVCPDSAVTPSMGFTLANGLSL